MRYTKMRLSSGTTVVDLTFQDVPPDEVFVCKDIQGLGPTTVDVTISNPLNQPGVVQSRVPQNRQIIATIGLAPDYTVGQTSSDLRDLLYELLDPAGDADTIRVGLWDATQEWVFVDGSISKMEPAIFSKDPEVVVTIDCISGYLSYYTDDVIASPTWDKTDPAISNIGTAPTGFVMSLTFTGSVAYWRINDSDTTGIKEIRIDRPFVPGDQLVIDTRPGSLALTRYHSPADPLNLMPYLSTNSSFFTLHRGVNHLHTSSPLFNWNSFTYRPMFRGI